MNDIQVSPQEPFEAGSAGGKLLAARTYNLVVSGLIFLGFLVMGAETYLTGTRDFMFMMASGSGFGIMFGSLIGSIVGIVLMSVAAGKQSVGLSLAGFALFVCTFGLISSLALVTYDLPTINTAFAATAAITFVFGALGVTFPQFFRKAYGVGMGILFAVVLVELVLMFAGVSQTITDWIVVVVFAGFIGYDTYMATQVPPTLSNAVLAASNLYVDIINVFLRILDIIGRRD